jgi:hypothetical protein
LNPLTLAGVRAGHCARASRASEFSVSSSGCNLPLPRHGRDCILDLASALIGLDALRLRRQLWSASFAPEIHERSERTRVPDFEGTTSCVCNRLYLTIMFRFVFNKLSGTPMSAPKLTSHDILLYNDLQRMCLTSSIVVLAASMRTFHRAPARKIQT